MRIDLVRIALCLGLGLTAGLTGFGAGPAAGQDEDKPYTITDGKVDWYTYNGYRRYHAACHVCHGPDGLGSSFGPNLVDSMKVLSHEDFLEVVANGRQNVSQSSFRAMPALGMNPNVMCFVDDIYAYLEARSDGALPRGRPKHEPKPAEAKERDESCLGS